jgi:hypothetical protein
VSPEAPDLRSSDSDQGESVEILRHLQNFSQRPGENIVAPDGAFVLSQGREPLEEIQGKRVSPGGAIETGQA